MPSRPGRVEGRPVMPPRQRLESSPSNWKMTTRRVAFTRCRSNVMPVAAGLVLARPSRVYEVEATDGTFVDHFRIRHRLVLADLSALVVVVVALALVVVVAASSASGSSAL